MTAKLKPTSEYEKSDIYFIENDCEEIMYKDESETFGFATWAHLTEKPNTTKFIKYSALTDLQRENAELKKFIKQFELMSSLRDKNYNEQKEKLQQQIAELVKALDDAYKRIDDKARHHHLEGNAELYKIMNIVSILTKYKDK